MQQYLFAIFLLQIIPIICFNYCFPGKKMVQCSSGKKHFICNMENELEKDNGAEYLGHVPDTFAFRQRLVDRHNEWRNALAKGDIKNEAGKPFPKARRMREVVWDTELAYMAKIHSGLIANKHSGCHSTYRFPYAGQNLAWFAGPLKNVKGMNFLVDMSCKNWFTEHLLVADPDDLIFKNPNWEKAGHMTVMANDRVSRIGCGMAAAKGCRGADTLCYYVTCHYEYTNLSQSYIYKAGDTASACSEFNATKSKRYEGLCTNTGEYYSMSHPSIKG